MESVSIRGRNFSQIAQEWGLISGFVNVPSDVGVVCLAPGACHVLKKSASSYMLPLCTRLYEKMCPFVAEDLAKLVQGALRSALWWLSPAGTTQQAVRKSTQRRL